MVRTDGAQMSPSERMRLRAIGRGEGGLLPWIVTTGNADLGCSNSASDPLTTMRGAGSLPKNAGEVSQVMQRLVIIVPDIHDPTVIKILELLSGKLRDQKKGKDAFRRW